MDKKRLFNFRSPIVAISPDYDDLTESENTPQWFASELMQVRTQFHIWHLQAQGSGSFAMHLAIGEFYSSMSGFVDSFVETIQGKTKSILKGYTTEPVMDLLSKEQVIAELDEFKQDCENYRTSLPTSWANIDNQIQVIIDQIEQTIYKLNFLQ